MLIALDKKPIIDKIVSNIYLGDIEAAKNKNILDRYNIKNIICLIPDKYERFNNIKYFDFPINDSRNEDITIYFEKINEILKNETANILIHCHNAVSRSVTVLIAYLIDKGIPFKETLFIIKSSRNVPTKPNLGFFKQLLRYELNKTGKSSLQRSDYFNL